MRVSNDGLGRALPGQFDNLAPEYPYANRQPVRQSDVMRRRVIVFFSVFLLSALVSLTYTFMRPAVYLASARLQITPAAKLPASEAAPAPDATQAFLLELQLLNSRPLLEKAVARLAEKGELRVTGADPVLAVQEMLSVSRVENTSVVHIEAQGPDRTFLPRLVNGLIEVYREEQALTGKSATQVELGEAREEARVVELRVAAKKQEMEAFRMRSNIVSTERDENQTLSRLKGLGASINAAADREAVAEGKLHAMEKALGDGQRPPQSRDSPAVTGMEQRLSQLRDDWRALERQFTPQYLELDPSARALKTRIDNLQQQLEAERRNSQQNALAAAREELAGAKATTQRLQQKLADEKLPAQTFTRRFGELQTMQEELRGLEQMRQTVRKRVLGLEASERARKPRMLVLEAAVAPQTAWQPEYWRDAGISVAASVLLGFLAVWFIEFFNRTEAAPAGPSTVIIPQPWLAVPHAGALQLGAAAMPSLPGSAQGPLLAPPRARELDDAEVRGMLANATAENLPLLVCLFSGIGAAALVALRVAHVDTGAGTLTIPGEPGYTLPLEGPLMKLSRGCAGLAGDTPLFPHANGQPLTVADVHSTVTSSAFDANLRDAQDVAPETLRHTYVAFLVRQGLRFSELAKVVGRIPSAELTALAPLASTSERIGLDAVERWMPAIRDLKLD